MPDPQKFVTSLELSKKLKELGVPQDSLFYWADGEVMFETGNADMLNFGEIMTNRLHKFEGKSPDYICSAFTTGELGEMLPEYIRIKGKDYWVDQMKHTGRWTLNISQVHGVHNYKSFTAETEAEARGKLLICLLENDLLSLKDEK